jgi:ketosteroid isomerase-like protein
VSQEADLVRHIYDAWNELGPDAMLESWHVDCEWHEVDELPGASVHRGREEVREYLRSLVEAVGSFRCEIEDLREEDRGVAVDLRLRGTTPTGVPLDYRVLHVHEVRDGQVAVLRAYGRSA